MWKWLDEPSCTVSSIEHKLIECSRSLALSPVGAALVLAAAAAHTAPDGMCETNACNKINGRYEVDTFVYGFDGAAARTPRPLPSGAEIRHTVR